MRRVTDKIQQTKRGIVKMNTASRSRILILILAALSVAVNVVLGIVVGMMNIPLIFLDTMGTIFSAAAFGPLVGMGVGLATNLVMGITAGATAIPFALVNIAVGLVVGLMAKKGFGIIIAVITGLILSAVAPMIGAPIRIFMFGGLTGSGTDMLIIALRTAGQDMLTSTFWGAVVGNFVDKIASCILVSLLLQNKAIQNALPLRWKKAAKNAQPATEGAPLAAGAEPAAQETQATDEK